MDDDEGNGDEARSTVVYTDDGQLIMLIRRERGKASNSKKLKRNSMLDISTTSKRPASDRRAVVRA